MRGDILKHQRRIGMINGGNIIPASVKSLITQSEHGFKGS